MTVEGPVGLFSEEAFMLAFVIGPNAVSGKPDNPQSKQASDGNQCDSDRHSHAVSPPSPARSIGKLSSRLCGFVCEHT